jgi:hypothetical protein
MFAQTTPFTVFTEGETILYHIGMANPVWRNWNRPPLSVGRRPMAASANIPPRQISAHGVLEGTWGKG